MDAIGGDRGVDVQGVPGVQGFIVTPHAMGRVGLGPPSLLYEVSHTGPVLEMIASCFGGCCSLVTDEVIE